MLPLHQLADQLNRERLTHFQDRRLARRLRALRRAIRRAHRRPPPPAPPAPDSSHDTASSRPGVDAGAAPSDHLRPTRRGTPDSLRR
jgi:hypothetical protein